MGTTDRHDSMQDKYAASCRLSGRMLVLTLCGACNHPVAGVIVRDKPGQYCIECKGCGFSATSHFSDGHPAADNSSDA
jgi:hypothetical protein